MERRGEKNSGVLIMLAALVAALTILGMMIWTVYGERRGDLSDRAVLVYSDEEAQRWNRDA